MSTSSLPCMRKRAVLGLQMAKLSFRGESVKGSVGIHHREIRSVSMSAHVDVDSVQGCLHHCLSELSLVEDVKPTGWKQARHQQASWMVGQTTAENKVADLNLQHLMLVSGLDWVYRLHPYLTRKAPGPFVLKAPHPAARGGSEAQLMGAHRPCQADGIPWALQAKTWHPFASCCSWISSWRVHNVFSATLIDGFIFQSIYLLNYPIVSRKSFHINTVISQSGWQQKQILVRFVEKADVPQFQFISGFPHQQSVN